MVELPDLNFYRMLIEQWDALVAVVTGPDHVYALANAAYRNIFGKALVGLPVRQALPEASPQLFGVLDRVYCSGQTLAIASVPIVCKGRNPASLFIDFTYQALKTQNGDIAGVTIQGIDVTSHIMLQDELRANAAMASETLDAMPLSIALFDKFMILRVINAVALDASGLRAEDVTNRHYREITGEERFALRKPVLDHVLQGNEISFDEEWLHPNGARKVLNYCFIPRRIDNDVVGFYLVTREASPQPQRLN